MSRQQAGRQQRRVPLGPWFSLSRRAAKSGTLLAPLAAIGRPAIRKVGTLGADFGSVRI
eukprot:COSAG01_NODE_3209_length_6417_cov_3.078189_6_plen_58_part_01